MSEQLAVTKPAELMRLATDAAGLCKAIAEQTAVSIQGRKYVRIEGWQAIATAHGCLLSARDVQKIDGGIRAIGEVRRISDGVVVGTAEGFVGDTEKTWAGREEYAKRAMAQTRAMSRAGRSAFAHVVVMMGAGLETTPAEEVPHGGFDDARNVTPAAHADAEADAEARQEPAAPAPQPAPRPQPSGKFKTISEKQAKRLWAIASGSGVERDEITRLLSVRYPYIIGEDGHIHIGQIAPADYDAACAWAQSGFAAEREPGTEG
jgi:hypothetical protein